LPICLASASNRGIELQVEDAPLIPGQLLGDDLRIKQVLINLVSNAIKFTEQGRVSLPASPAGRNALRSAPIRE